jgi:CubicO group peptidase (beta-lactamase class C family)
MSLNASTITPTDRTQIFTNEDIADLNAKFHELVDDGKLANVVTLVAHRGKIVNCDAYGVHDVSASPSIPVTTDSIFRIASMTKPITSAAMMMLWEEDKWALEDPVSRFVPEFEGLKVKREEDGELVPQETPMTMRQLMSHSAGLGGRNEYDDLDVRGGTLQDMIDILAARPLSFQPGKEWRYGYSVDVLGYIIQKLTGKLLDEFLEERLFAPLGMVDTGFFLPLEKVDRIVSVHKYNENKDVVAVNREGTYKTARPKFLAGGGGLMLSTATDFWRFSQMILNGGEFEGKRYLKASTVELMHTQVLEPGVTLQMFRRPLHGFGFGLGFAIVQDSVVAKTAMENGSYFWAGLYGTWFWIDPEKDLVVVGLINVVKGQLPPGSPSLRDLSAESVYRALNREGYKKE